MVPASTQINAIFGDISGHTSGSSEFIVMQLMEKEEERARVLNR